MMTEREALLIADPGTREQALGEYARNRHLRSASLEAACEVLGSAYKRVSGERDAAVKDLEELMMSGTPGDDACFICKRWEICKEEVSHKGVCNCRPEWRRPKGPGVVFTGDHAWTSAGIPWDYRTGGKA